MVRSDAARNRAAILACADRLFAQSPAPASVTMDDIARAAGVGKGTLFRRFGDRAHLIRAIVEHRMEALRHEVDSGAGPLGPHTAARERLVALLGALLDFKLRNRHLTLALESNHGGNPYGPNYAWAHRVFTETLSTVPLTTNAAWLAHTLLSAVRADLVEHLIEQEGFSIVELKRELAALVEQATGPAPQVNSAD